MQTARSGLAQECGPARQGCAANLEKPRKLQNVPACHCQELCHEKADEPSRISRSLCGWRSLSFPDPESARRRAKRRVWRGAVEPATRADESTEHFVDRRGPDALAAVVEQRPGADPPVGAAEYPGQASESLLCIRAVLHGGHRMLVRAQYPAHGLVRPSDRGLR